MTTIPPADIFLPKDVLEWLFSDDSGSSSKAIVFHFYGICEKKWWNYPLDSSDMGRCVRMLEKFPWIGIEHMKEVNPVWRALAVNWVELTEAYHTEAYHKVMEEDSKAWRVTDEEILALHPRTKKWSNYWYKYSNEIRDRKRRLVYKQYFGNLLDSVMDSVKVEEKKILADNHTIVIKGC